MDNIDIIAKMKYEQSFEENEEKEISDDYEDYMGELADREYDNVE